MILRRITRHVKRQDWFAVWLDLIVVVAGIYIGLQADAWMSSRLDRDIERIILPRYSVPAHSMVLIRSDSLSA